MSDSLPNPAPPKERSTLKVVLIVVGSLMLVGLLGCCGMMALAYFGFNSGLNQELRPQLAENPVIQEELGEIESISFDFGETMTAAQSRPGESVMSCEVTGSKGSGTVVIEVNQGGDPEMIPVLLKTSDGREISLLPSDDIPTAEDTAGDEMDDADTTPVGESTGEETGDGTEP